MVTKATGGIDIFIGCLTSCALGTVDDDGTRWRTRFSLAGKAACAASISNQLPALVFDADLPTPNAWRTRRPAQAIGTQRRSVAST
jgi:hypothetical protein